MVLGGIKFDLNDGKEILLNVDFNLSIFLEVLNITDGFAH